MARNRTSPRGRRPRPTTATPAQPEPEDLADPDDPFVIARYIQEEMVAVDREIAAELAWFDEHDAAQRRPDKKPSVHDNVCYNDYEDYLLPREEAFLWWPCGDDDEEDYHPCN